jgi:hypothetical protein
MLRPSTAEMMAKTAPMEKQMMKKSPDESSRIKQAIAITAHTCHMFCKKYSIISLLY